MRFAMAAYSWPIFMMMNTGTGLWKLMPYLRYVTWGSPWLPIVDPSSWWWIQGLGFVNWCFISGMSHEVHHGCLWLIHLQQYQCTGTGLCKLMPYLRYGWQQWTWGLPWLPMVGPSWWWIQGLGCLNWCLIWGMSCEGLWWLPRIGQSLWCWIQGLGCIN